MPGGDGTGPVGRGPRTGRGGGYCAGYPAPSYMSSAGGGGFWGRGRGVGWGRCHWYYATGLPFWARVAQGFFGAPTAEQERDALRQQSQQLQDSLNAINRRIEDLDQEKSR